MARSRETSMRLLTLMVVGATASSRSLPANELGDSEAAPSAFATVITPDPSYQPLMYAPAVSRLWKSYQLTGCT